MSGFSEVASSKNSSFRFVHLKILSWLYFFIRIYTNKQTENIKHLPRLQKYWQLYSKRGKKNKNKNKKVNIYVDCNLIVGFPLRIDFWKSNRQWKFNIVFLLMRQDEAGQEEMVSNGWH